MAATNGYTAEIGQAICDHIADGKSLRKWCAIEGNASKSTVMRWLADDAGFRDLYAVAREMGADSFAEDTIDIADEEADPARARVRVSSRQWMAARLAPKKYGDRLELGGQVTVGRVSRTPISEDAWENRHGET